MISGGFGSGSFLGEWRHTLEAQDWRRQNVHFKQCGCLALEDNEHVAFYISLVIWDPIHLFGLLLNREIGLIVHLFDILDIYIRHSPDNSN